MPFVSRYAAALLGVAGLACGRSSGQPQLADLVPAPIVPGARVCAPVTANRRWSEPREEQQPSGPTLLHYNQAPGQDPGFDPALLVGDYDFVAVATAGTLAADTLGLGSLWLAATDTLARHAWCEGPFQCRNSRIVYPLWGAFDPAFHFPGLEAVAYPASSRSPERPGILMSYDTVARRLEAVVGNADRRMTDTGVFLDVFAASETGFTGRWVTGGLAIFGGPGADGARSQGHFCAWRRR